MEKKAAFEDISVTIFKEGDRSLQVHRTHDHVRKVVGIICCKRCPDQQFSTFPKRSTTRPCILPSLHMMTKRSHAAHAQQRVLVRVARKSS